uniref:Peptidase S1 domain-containing protein n=1 Tax=Stomoxys calcitrans TaxID=35570 RepID=A0A1I8PA18_STOCA
MNIKVGIFVVLSLLLRYANSSGKPFTNNSEITFPTLDFRVDCDLPDSSKGICQLPKYCPAAITAKSVSVCYEDDTNTYVCCKRDLWDDFPKRRLTAGCGFPVQSISNGLRTEYMEFPYMAALGWESFFGDDVFDYKCGGVLIDYIFVLTAAHCANLQGVPPSVVLLGGGDLTDTTKKPVKVIDTIIHPDYKSTESYHDIALLKLDNLRYYKSPICAWSIYPLDSINLTAIGYGHIHFAGPSSDNLLKTYLSVIPNNECSAYFPHEESLPRGIVETQLCAQDFVRQSDTCQGDSGGPLILNSVSPYHIVTSFVVGITSFGRGCAMDTPGVYTRVSEYIDWIEEVVYADK